MPGAASSGRPWTAAGCAERTIRRSLAVTTRLSKRLPQPWHSDSAARAGARAKAVVPRPGRARLDPGDRDSKLDSARGDRRHWRCLCMPGRRRSAPRFRFPHRGGGLRLWRAIRSPRRRVVRVAQSRRKQHGTRRPVEPDFRSGAEQKVDVGLNAVPRLVHGGSQDRCSGQFCSPIRLRSSDMSDNCNPEKEKRGICPSLELRASSEARRDPARSRWRRRPPSTN